MVLSLYSITNSWYTGLVRSCYHFAVCVSNVELCQVSIDDLHHCYQYEFHYIHCIL